MTIERGRSAVIRHYARLAADYDARWSSYVQAATEETMKRVPSSPGGILDVGCGTGQLLNRIVNRFPDSAVAGVDASPEMLVVAKTRLPDRVTLKTGWAEELPFEDETFGTVVSCNMFHFIRQPEAALNEMLRVVRPDGTLVITDWCDDYFSYRFWDFYLRWFDPSHFRMYRKRECRDLLAAAGAVEIRIEKYKISWLWGLMTAIAIKPQPK